MNQTHAFEVKRPSQKEKAVAQRSVTSLGYLKNKKNLPAYLTIKDQQVQLPQSAVLLLVEILNQLADGNALTLIPKHALLTTQEAADFLNVSRPFLVKLLESGEIPFEKVGNRRRVLAEDVNSYKLKQIESRKEALQKLADEAQDLNMDY